jgi:uncharacterized protein YwgA
MEPRLQVLSLFLSALGEEQSIASLDDRLRLQKAVYLGQALGVDLGYRYSWYVKGPYCPSLTQDYYKLNEVAGAVGPEIGLRPDVLEKLTEARVFLEKPEHVNLGKPQWYELLASLHYLRYVSKQPDENIRKTISENKEHLVFWVDEGFSHLKKFQKI